MVQINADKEEAEVVRVKVEAEEATANEKVSFVSTWMGKTNYPHLYTHISELSRNPGGQHAAAHPTS